MNDKVTTNATAPAGAPSATPPVPRRRSPWVMARGERSVLAAGLAVAGVVVGVLGASWWWTRHTFEQAASRSRAEQVELVARLLGGSAESMLADAEATAVRRLIAESASRHGLRECRVLLGDGTVVADAQTSRIKPGALPERFPTLPADEAGDGELHTQSGVAKIRLPLVVAGRGRAVLEVEADARAAPESSRDALAGVGVIGAGGMLGVWGVYRAMRRRWRAVDAVTEALRLERSGRATAGALDVGDGLGPLARAWNAVVRERDALRQQVLVKAAGERLSASGPGEADLQAACDALWQGILLVDDRGSVKYGNGAAAVLLRARRDQLAGTPLERHIDSAPACDAVLRVARGESKARASVEVERAGSSASERAVLRLSARPLRRDEGAGAIVVVEDVTQQRVADESRNAFVAQATHELRTPLTNMRLFIETMVEQGEDAGVRAKCLNVIGTEARRLERVVGDMLSVSEIEAGAFKLRTSDVRLDALFEELAADFSAQAENKEITLAFDLPPKFPVLQGDRDKLVLALNNLIGNALKYTPAGGAVTVKVDADGAELRVAVIDNGIGIKPEEQELIFEKFYRAKDKRISSITGSGIGLALARQVVRLHGGDIACSSQIDKGSTFTLTLPLAPAGGAARAA